MARPYPHERLAAMREEHGTINGKRLYDREMLEHEINDIEDISDVRQVLFRLLDMVRTH